MKNIQTQLNIRSAFAFLVLFALAFVLVLPAQTHAYQQSYGYIPPAYNTNHSYNPGGGIDDVGYIPATQSTTVIHNAPAPTVVYRTVYVPANTTTNNTTTNTNNSTDNTSTDSNDGSSLASSVILGSGGFLPSGIIGWIFFAILILIIVILVRKVTGGAKRYHEAPLKHA